MNKESIAMTQNTQNWPDGTTHIKKRPLLGDGAIKVSNETVFFHFQNRWQPCSNVTAKEVTADQNVYIPIKNYN
jgi:hypothetical protein